MNLIFSLLIICLLKSTLAIPHSYNTNVRQMGRMRRNFQMQGETNNNLCNVNCNCENKPKNHICGTDGRTYKNLCELNCANQCNTKLKKSFEGICPEMYVHYEPTERPMPGKSELHSEHFDQLEEEYKVLMKLGRGQKINISYSQRVSLYGERKPNCDIWSLCPMCATDKERKWIPFCGNDGFTYDNFCDLQCAAKYCDSQLRNHFEGVCDRSHGKGKSERTRTTTTTKSPKKKTTTTSTTTSTESSTTARTEPTTRTPTTTTPKTTTTTTTPKTTTTTTTTTTPKTTPTSTTTTTPSTTPTTTTTTTPSTTSTTTTTTTPSTTSTMTTESSSPRTTESTTSTTIDPMGDYDQEAPVS